MVSYPGHGKNVREINATKFSEKGQVLIKFTEGNLMLESI